MPFTTAQHIPVAVTLITDNLLENVPNSRTCVPVTVHWSAAEVLLASSQELGTHNGLRVEVGVMACVPAHLCADRIYSALYTTILVYETLVSTPPVTFSAECLQQYIYL